MVKTTARALADSQPLADNLTALRDRPAVSIAVFGEGWAGDCAGSALAEIARLQAQVDALSNALKASALARQLAADATSSTH